MVSQVWCWVADNKADKSGWLLRLKTGLSRTAGNISDGIGSILIGRHVDEEVLADIEDLLISSDFGVTAARMLIESLAKTKISDSSEKDIREIISSEITNILTPVAQPLTIESANTPHVILVTGVNGVGKTTTIGKLAATLVKQKKKVILAAGDTFRAAAVEQLQVWGNKAGAPVLTRDVGEDSAAVAFDALKKAISDQADALIIDTAGRLQNKVGLMAELAKIPRVLKKMDNTAPHSVVLVLDATTGQNAHSQVELFREACGVTGLMMTKLDGTARGGVLVSLAEKFSLPIHAVGVGEGLEDLQAFEPRAFARALVGLSY